MKETTPDGRPAGDADQAVQSQLQRGPGRPPRDPRGEPLGVSPGALAQAVLRPPKPKRDE